MLKTSRWAPVAGLALLGAIGCNDFLTGGDLSEDPNRPLEATNRQLFVGVQTNIWSFLASDMVRVTQMWAQQLAGNAGQYAAIFNYGVNEQTTNGFNTALYVGGGLVDVRRLQESARSEGDQQMLGVAQVQEAILIGTGADLFGDLVYTEALTDTPNPPLTPQLEVYDAVQALLDEAITNLAATGPSNIGPGESDLSYGGDPVLWTKLAHTLKARFFLHTAEVRPEAYAQALTEARQGITDPAEDFIAPFSGASFEQNFWYQFIVVQREGYLSPDADFVALLRRRSDPRLTAYFDPSGSALSEARLAPDFAQPLIQANENLLVWAEAAFRTGAAGEALTQMNAERANVGLGPLSASGDALLREILTEKYIAGFQTLEPWNDYKRTCFPNLTPVTGSTIPVRLFYDTQEQQTNTSIPPADQQPVRNANDPPNATDPFGAECLGQ